jgi:hypothetical protein
VDISGLGQMSPVRDLACGFGRDRRAELHRLMLDFLAAGANGNRSNHRSKNDSGLHVFSPMLSLALPNSVNDVIGHRNVGADSHWRVQYCFATRADLAGRKLTLETITPETSSLVVHSVTFGTSLTLGTVRAA